MAEMAILLSLNELSRYNLHNKKIVIIDTLRVGTTIAAALASGIEYIYPFSKLSSIYKFYKRKRNKNKYIFVGEEEGQKLNGFDFGNSPLTFSKNSFTNKNIILKTGNGLAELNRLCKFNRAFIGSLVNSSKVVEEIINNGEDICLVCAGNNGAFSLEDFFTAGRYSYLLKKAGWCGDDLTTAAGRIYEDNSTYDEIVNLFYHSQKGNSLCKMGFEKDIRFSSRIDIFDIVPVFWKNRISEKRISFVKYYVMGVQ